MRILLIIGAKNFAFGYILKFPLKFVPLLCSVPLERGQFFVTQLRKLVLSAGQSFVVRLLADRMWIHQCECLSYYWKAVHVDPILPTYVRSYKFSDFLK